MQPFSRRTFMQAAIAGASGTLITNSKLAEGKATPGAHSAVPGPSADLASLTIADASELIRKKKVSPIELTEACLHQIERLNPALNSFITITAESALAEARDAEAEIQRGKWRGPLHGVPVALKDLFDTAGVRTTAASGVFKDRVPKEDAEVVRRLKAAGAVLLGKLNMHEFAFGGTSIPSYFGAVHNPWDVQRTPGGSSGGSAAAVAAGLCFGALGSDTAGSIRLPAAYCGVVGLKPTYGLVSTRGVIPLSWTLDHVGPITRTVADAAMMLHVIAGYDADEPTSVKMPVHDYIAALHAKVSPFRLGVVRDFFFAGLDPEIESAAAQAISVLKQLGASVHDMTLPPAVEASTQEKLRSTVRAAEAYAYHAEYVTKTPELYQAETLGRLRSAAEVSTLAYVQGRLQLARVRREIGKVFGAVDAIVAPTIPVPPPTIADLMNDQKIAADFAVMNIRNTSPFDVYGIPSISIPCGFTRAGLPIGLQISGPEGGEAMLMQIAHAYEHATDWSKRRPGVIA